MRPIDPALDEAARAILDGTPHDWTGLESSGDPDAPGLINQLRTLATIAELHRREPAQTMWGQLRLLERVGVGGYGEVYRAWDARLDREVALKLLPAGRHDDAILEEGRRLARVRHPNVITIYGAEKIGDRIGLSMEFVRGGTLEQRLRSGHQFTRGEVVSIGLNLCRAVSAVHVAGLLHRDIKAQNVMVADDGRVLLMDFGTSIGHGSAATPASGTPLYLAPEIFAGAAASRQSDIYSIGVLLYRLLTGAYPVSAESVDDLRRAHAQRQRVALLKRRADAPTDLAAVIDRAIDPDPAKRPQTCDVFAAQLTRLGAHSRPRWWAAAVLALAAVVGSAGWVTMASTSAAGVAAWSPHTRPVIVVMPLRNLTTRTDGDLIVDGLTIELIRNLAIINGLDVRPERSSFAFKDKTVSLAELGRSLHVNLVLDGSVTIVDDRLRVQAQLANVGTDEPIWTNKYDRPITNLLAVQDEIARDVVNHLRLRLGTGQRRYDLDPEAQQLYLKARALVARRGTDNADAALSLFEQVIARDPAYAPAYAGLAGAYSAKSQDLPDVLGMPHLEALEKMRVAATTAITLDPMLAESHAAMGLLHSREWAWDDAVREFSRAIELNPSLSDVYSAYSLTTLLPLGRFAYAEAMLEDALRRDPTSLELKRDLVLQQITAGRYEQALANIREIRATDPRFPAVTFQLARALSLSGRIAESIPVWDTSSGIGWEHWTAYTLVRARRRAEVEAMAARPQVPFRAMFIEAALGHTDKAFEAMSAAADTAPHRLVRALRYPELAALRGDPRFQAMLERFHLR